MLVIRRKPGEAVFIGTDVEVRILELNVHRVVLGIDAPSSITILRKEIRDAAEQNQSAARSISTSTAASLAARLRQNSVR